MRAKRWPPNRLRVHQPVWAPAPSFSGRGGSGGPARGVPSPGRGSSTLGSWSAVRGRPSTSDVSSTVELSGAAIALGRRLRDFEELLALASRRREALRFLEGGGGMRRPFTGSFESRWTSFSDSVSDCGCGGVDRGSAGRWGRGTSSTAGLAVGNRSIAAGSTPGGWGATSTGTHAGWSRIIATANPRSRPSPKPTIIALQRHTGLPGLSWFAGARSSLAATERNSGLLGCRAPRSGSWT